MKSILNRAIDSPDVALAAAGSILSLPLILYLQMTLHQPLFTTIGIICFFSFLAYLVLRLKVRSHLQVQVKGSQVIYLLLNILFFCLLTYTVFAVHLRPDHYSRPLGYFIAVATMVAILAVEILFLPQRRATTFLALFKIIIIGFSLQWSQQLIFPGLVGADPWWHQAFTLKVLNAGQTPAAYGYSKVPCFHLMIGATSLITGLNYKLAAMLSVGLLQIVCDSLFVFLLGKFIHSAKAGLLAALILVIASFHIQFSFSLTPNTMGVLFIPIITYLLFKLRHDKSVTSIFLSALFMVALLFTHTVSAVCLGVFLFLLWLGFEIYKRLHYQAALSGKIFLVAGIIFTVAALSWWTFGSGYLNSIMRMVRAEFSGEIAAMLPPEKITSPETTTLPETSAQAEDTTPPELTPLPQGSHGLIQALAYYRDSVPFSEHLFRNLGLFLFFALAFIGSFAMLSKETRNSHGIALVFSGLVILAINFLAIVTYRHILTHRWLYFLQVMLSIPVGFSLLWFSSLLRNRYSKSILLGCIAFALAFLSIMSPYANLDNRTFSPYTLVRFAFTRSEIQAAITASEIWDGKIASDWHVGDLLRFLPDIQLSYTNTKYINEQLISRDFHKYQNTLLLIRQEIVQHPFYIPKGAYRIAYDPSQALTEQGFSHIYDCGSVNGFIKQI